MWVLDNKEGWVLKNWCFQIVELGKTLESPVKCQEIKPVNPKGNQPWLFIWRTDAETKVLILWLSDAKSWLIGKELDAGKDWRQNEKVVAEDDSLIALTTQFSSVQLLSHVRLFVTPWPAAHQASLSITNSQSPPKPMSIESVMPSNYLIFCCPLLLLPSIFSSIRVFSNESALSIRGPKYWSYSFNISPSNEHSGLISFRMDWSDLLAVQGTLKSLPQLQFKSINSSALSFLHSPTLTSIHDHLKNLSLD